MNLKNPDGIEEASRYKYPPGLKVFKSLVGRSTGLRNIKIDSVEGSERFGDTVQNF